MPRKILLGNGNLLATLDENMQMRDIYFPYVGMEDHTFWGDTHKVGVWVEGKGIRWFDDDSWEISAHYKMETLVNNSILRNDELGIEIKAQDFVHPVHNILMRDFFVRSTDGENKQIRIFFNHDLHIYGDKQKDTAFYEPYTNSVIHYRARRYFLIGGITSNPTECIAGRQAGAYESVLHSKEKIQGCGINSYSIGKAEFRGLEGTWKDAEDGNLSNTTIDQGSVDSTVGIHCNIGPNEDTEVALWMCFGKKLDDVVDLHQIVLKERPERLQRNCHNYWKSWVNKKHVSFGSLSKDLVDLYKRSLLMIRMHADNNGGILAAADADIMEFNRDTYTYVWPRDGAFVCMALDKAGYMEPTRRFYEFCCKIQTDDGYMLHKYNPDGSFGSSWHPWFAGTEPQLPIQEDETALVICAIWNHFQCTQDFEFLQKMYEQFLKKAAKFMSEFREKDTGLPLPSYDPWEEHRGIFTYTTSCTIAGLRAAAKISHALGHFNHYERYTNVADEICQAFLYHMYDEEHQRFAKMIRRDGGETVEKDMTPDASMITVWKLGVLPTDDPRVVSTMEQLESALKVHTEVGGYARYTRDFYHAKVEPSDKVPGNPWIITTLWFAQWDIARAKTIDDLQAAREKLDWVSKYASSTGMLAEQLHPLTGKHLSVAPLTWSHATYVETVLLYLEKEKELNS